MAFGPHHVVIVDDDPSHRRALGRLLKSAGMVVDTYEEGRQFFASLALKIPHCLILDFQMPGLNGLDVLRHLGQRSIRIPAIIVTAHDTKGIREDCLSAGAIAFLCKPVDANHLIQTIRRSGSPGVAFEH